MSRRPARILLVTHSLSGGGAERFVATLAARLDRSRFAPSIVAATARATYPIPDDVPVTALGYRGVATLPRTVLRLRRAIARAAPDLVLSNVLSTNCLTGAALAGREPRAGGGARGRRGSPGSPTRPSTATRGSSASGDARSTRGPTWWWPTPRAWSGRSCATIPGPEGGEGRGFARSPTRPTSSGWSGRRGLPRATGAGGMPETGRSGSCGWAGWSARSGPTWRSR